MNAVDTNILVYASRADSPWHARADAALTALAESLEPWAIPWPCVCEFLAVVTNPRIYRPATPPAVALQQVSDWLESPHLVLLSESPGFMPTLAQTIRRGAVVGSAIHDARIAALCIHHGVDRLLTADRDFTRFPQLRTANPLVQ